MVKLGVFLQDLYPQQINDIVRPNSNFSAYFKFLNTADYTYLPENSHYTTTTELLETC